MTDKKTSKAAPKLADYAAATLAKYMSAGWCAFLAPKSSINDIIAHKDRKLHFVQIVPKTDAAASKFNGLPRNNFIQNAFSNMATPVYAHITLSKSAIMISLEDINANTKIIIGKKKKEAPPPAPAPAPAK